jgi:hypothetical protein
VRWSERSERERAHLQAAGAEGARTPETVSPP